MKIREVVAGIIFDGDNVCLVRRSMSVGSDPGLWHCVTGYLEPRTSPRRQILNELHEELGLERSQIVKLSSYSPIRLSSQQDFWIIHTFLVHTNRRDFVLNWENDDYRWLSTSAMPLESVSWLSHVVVAVGLGRN